MTLTQWNRAIKYLDKHGSIRLPDGSEVIKWDESIVRYGPEYSLRSDDGQCVICTRRLEEIRRLVVD